VIKVWCSLGCYNSSNSDRLEILPALLRILKMDRTCRQNMVHIWIQWKSPKNLWVQIILSHLHMC